MNWDKSEPEADAAEAITGAEAAPVRRTAELRAVVPTAATDHADRAGRWSNWIRGISTVTCVPIPAPLKNIAVHVIQPPVIGTFLTDSLVFPGTTILAVPSNLIQITA